MIGDKKQVRDCVFISLRDKESKQFIDSIKLPSGATNFTLWYKKSDPNNWGLTIKKFERKTDVFPTQHIWKITWINREGKLVPCTQLDGFTMEILDGEKYKFLDEYKKVHIDKNLNK